MPPQIHTCIYIMRPLFKIFESYVWKIGHYVGLLFYVTLDSVSYNYRQSKKFVFQLSLPDSFIQCLPTIYVTYKCKIFIFHIWLLSSLL